MPIENVYTSPNKTREPRAIPDSGRSPKLSELKVSYRRPALRKTESKLTRPILNMPVVCFDYLRNIWDRDTFELREEIVLICLDSSLGVNGWIRLYAGGFGECTLDPKLLFGIVLTTASSGFILAHNHPSGNLRPSDGDRAVTRRMSTAAKILGIRFVDHIIASSNGYYSFRDAESKLFESVDDR